MLKLSSFKIYFKNINLLVGFLAFMYMSSVCALPEYASSHNSCEHMLQNLSVKQGDYIRCSTAHAVPVLLCLKCKVEHHSMTEDFELLKSNLNCSEKYFNHDRINVVETTQNMLQGLWTKAHCDDCIGNNKTEIFQEYLEVFTNCLKPWKKNEDKCKNCSYAYNILNDFYTKWDQNSNGAICYDLQDQMNHTRLQWSKEFKCCKRSFRMTLFLTAAVGIAGYFVMFYFGAYIITKRQENLHDTILPNTDGDIFGNDRQVVNPTPTPTAQQTSSVSTDQEGDKYSKMNVSLGKEEDSVSDDSD